MLCVQYVMEYTQHFKCDIERERKRTNEKPVAVSEYDDKSKLKNCTHGLQNVMMKKISTDKLE